MFVGVLQFNSGSHVPGVIRWISDLLQMTANHRLRLSCLRPNHCVETGAPTADVGITSEKIHCARTKPEELRHPGIVIVRFRQVTIGAVLGGSDATRRVRKMGIERLPAVAFSTDCLLLRVNPFAVCILRANHHCA